MAMTLDCGPAKLSAVRLLESLHLRLGSIARSLYRFETVVALTEGTDVLHAQDAHVPRPRCVLLVCSDPATRQIKTATFYSKRSPPECFTVLALCRKWLPAHVRTMSSWTLKNALGVCQLSALRLRLGHSCQMVPLKIFFPISYARPCFSVMPREPLPN